MTVRVQQIQSKLWKRICRISLPVIEKLNSNDCCNVKDKPLSKEECDFIGMLKGFDGSMYALGRHVYQYPSKKVNCHQNTGHMLAPMIYSQDLQLWQSLFHIYFCIIFTGKPLQFKKHLKVLMNCHQHALVAAGHTKSVFVVHFGLTSSS